MKSNKQYVLNGYSLILDTSYDSQLAKTMGKIAELKMKLLSRVATIEVDDDIQKH